MKIFLSLFIIVYAPIAYRICFDDAKSIEYAVSSLIFVLPLVFGIVCIRPKWLRLLSCFILTAVSLAECIMVVLYHEYLQPGHFFAVWQTNSEECKAFLQSGTSVFGFLVPLLVSFFVIVSDNFRTSRNGNYIKYALFSTLFLFLFIAVRIHTYPGYEVTYYSYIVNNLLERPPYSFFTQIGKAYGQIQLRHYIDDSENMSFGASHISQSENEIYVLAIGESLNYDHLSLTGYERTTTPHLDTIPNVAFLRNYYSAANNTLYSVPLMITRATADNYEQCYKEKSIFLPFKECGFKTICVCCNNTLDTQEYLRKGMDEYYSVKTDSDIPRLIDSLACLNTKVFFIVEFWANHSPYKNFSNSNNRYRPNPKYDDVGWADVAARQNAYDNTVLQLDDNLYDIICSINRIETLSALCFVPDHGEDFSLGPCGHGYNCSPQKAEYHVPLVFWGNNRWMEFNNDKFSYFCSHIDTPLSSDQIFYSVCDMANIRLGQEYEKCYWSFFNDSLEILPRKLLAPDGQKVISLD